MKKLRRLSLLLCAVLTLQCLAQPVSATETTAFPDLPEPTAAHDIVEEDKQAKFGTVSIESGCRTINGMVPLGGTERKLETAQGVFLFETTTNTVIYSYNPDTKLAPGNLAKIVTSLLALEMCDLDETVTASSANISKLPGGQNQKIKDGEQFTVRELVYMMMLSGANDAAIAIAEHVSGTQQAFLSLMNARVQQMGCTSTKFENVHGLNVAPSYTTARDLAKITVEALKNEDFKDIFGDIYYEIPPTNKTEKKRELITQNYMIDQRTIPDFYDERVTGGMQHYVASTGANLVCTAKYKGMEYVAVVLGCTRIMKENGWQPEKYGNFNEMTDLLKFGFDKFKINRILYEGMSLKQFPVAGGECYAVGQSFVDYDSVVPIAASMDNLNIKFFVLNGDLTAPVARDQKIATMEVWYRNSCMAEAEVFAMSDVKSAKNNGVNIRSTAVRSDADGSGFLSVLGTICVIILGLAVVYLTFNAYMRSRIRAQRRRRREARRRSRR